MLSNLFKSAENLKINRIILLCNSCVYSPQIKRKYKESDLFKGEPDASSLATGFSKLGFIVGARVNSLENNYKTTNIILPNLYGPHDNFKNENSHFIASIIKKIFNAKKAGKKILTLWGSGNEVRDTLYVTDVAKAIEKILFTKKKVEVLNVSNSREMKIKQYVNYVQKIFRSKIKIKWSEKYSGASKKVLDNKKLIKTINWLPEEGIESGLKKTIDWYLKNRSF